MPEPGQRLLHQTREIKKLVGEDKPIAACIAGPFTTAGMLVGVQDFMMLLVDEEMGGSFSSFC